MTDHIESRSTAEEGPRWGLPAGLILLALVLLLVVVRSQPPAPRPDAPPAEFAAGRARQVLQELLGDGRPHPVGSPANALVRDRIIARLRGLGFTPEVQRTSVCNFGLLDNCAWVENILARLPGRQPGGAVLLMAHYDSVGAGPGASDDMTGVAAILEVARALKAGPPPRHDVMLLLDDGEEGGLLGAKAFAADHPAAREVRAVVNLEARGTSGPSLMFETSGANSWLVSAYARNAPRPHTSSVFAAIYDQLPNDTDLTIFKRRPEPVPGLNFAFVESPTRYHTAVDDLASASPASLQQHGDNALAAVRGLAEADIANPPRGSAVFFDVLSLFVLRYPAPWSLGLALLALVLVIIAIVRGMRRGELRGRGLLFGVLAFLTALIVAGVGFYLLQILIANLGPFAIGWLAHPLPFLIAYWLLVLALVIAVSGLFRRAGAAGLWAGVWFVWALVGVVVAWLAVGLSYLFVLPALVAGLAGLASSSPRTSPAAAIVPALIAGLLWFPVILPLYAGLGAFAFLVIGVLLTVMLTSIAPLVPLTGTVWRRWLPLAALVLAVVLVIVGLRSPLYSAQSPQSLNFQYHFDADAGTARWLARSPLSSLPAGVRQVTSFEPQPAVPFPWSPPFARAYVAPAPTHAMPAPELTVLEDSMANGKRMLRFHLASPRGAPIISLVIPTAANLESLELDGRPWDLNDMAGRHQPGAAPPRDFRILTFLGVPAGGADLRVVLGQRLSTDWYLLDRNSGLPPGGEALQKARPDTTVAFQDGDNTIVSRKLRI